MLIDEKLQKIIAMRSGELVLNRESQCWTDDERKRLKRYFESGEGITDIAIMLERSETAILQQIEHMKLRERNIATSRRSSKGNVPSECLCKYCERDPALCPRCKDYKKKRENAKC